MKKGDKFLIVMETYVMNQADLAEYCRKKGLYKEQIEAWRDSCLNANARESGQSKNKSIQNVGHAQLETGVHMIQWL